METVKIDFALVKNPKLAPKFNQLSAEAESLVVSDQPSYEAAGEFLKSIKALASEVNETFDPIVAQAYAAHKEACNQKKKFSVPLDEIEKKVKEKMKVYYQEEQRRAEQERLRLEAEAKKKQEEEAMKNAELLEAQGESEEAAAVIQDAIDNTPIVNTGIDAPKASGVSARKVWAYKVVNVQNMNRDFMSPNDKAIASIVKSMGKKAETMVGGIQVYEDVIMGARKA